MDKGLIKKRGYELESVMQEFKRIGMSSHNKSGLKKSEIFMLWQISKLSEKASVTVSDIAKDSGITLAAVTHHTNSLEGGGYIERKSSSDDGRVFIIALSKKGEETVKKFKKVHWKKIRGLIEYLGEEDSKTLINLISKLTKYMGGESA